MNTTGNPSQLSGSTFGQRGHICGFFNSIDEQHRVVRAFINDGFDRRDRAFHLVDSERREEHLRWLAEAGIDVQEAMSTGQLEVVPWQDSYLRGGRFDLEAWLLSVEQLFEYGQAAGYPHTRAVAQMEWALTGSPGTEDLIEYETRLNYLIPKYEDAAICAYDLTKFGASVVMDALRTHPVVIIGGQFHENPFFVPPEQLLLEIRERR
jgi:MEDS: MEthanogen/methylotroph, DcmR Sensory domain